MRVVLDTNILISALISPQGTTDRLYQAWKNKRFTLVSSEEQLDEFRRVTRYPKLKPYIEPALAGTMLNELRLLAVVLTTLPKLTVSHDPADNFLLAMAIAGKADVLTTGDKHDLLHLHAYKSVKILSARRLAEILGL